MKKAFAYILTNDRRTVLYTGSTTNLKNRVYLHKKGLIPGFTKKYNVGRLVYFEKCTTTESARAREQLLKKTSRRRKVDLINSINPAWRDLHDDPQTML